MANKRICVQIDFNGPTPLVIRSNGTFDKRLSLLNIARLLRGIDKGSQWRTDKSTTGKSTVVVQDTLVQASGTFTASGVVATDTAVIGGTTLTATQLRASDTLTVALGNAGDTFVLNGSTFTAVSGAAGAQQYDVSSGVNATIAASIANAINTSVDPKVVGVVEAKSAAAIVTVYAKAIGTWANTIPLTSTGGARLVAATATLLNGAAAANNQYDATGTNNETAAELARAVNVSTSANVKQVVATVSTNVVTLTAKTPGVAGNAITTTQTGGHWTVSAGTLASGSAGAPTLWTF
jgi:hypothetical protein